MLIPVAVGTTINIKNQCAIISDIPKSGKFVTATGRYYTGEDDYISWKVLVPVRFIEGTTHRLKVGGR